MHAVSTVASNVREWTLAYPCSDTQVAPSRKGLSAHGIVEGLSAQGRNAAGLADERREA